MAILLGVELDSSLNRQTDPISLTFCSRLFPFDYELEFSVEVHFNPARQISTDEISPTSKDPGNAQTQHLEIIGF